MKTPIAVSLLVLSYLNSGVGFIQLQYPRSQAAQHLRAAYNAQRSQVIENEQSLQIGSQLRLSAAELRVDAHLKHLKRTEFDAGITDPAHYAPGLHFFVARPLIERSAVFRLLRRMPKGALLHGHSSAMVSGAWIVQNLTYHSEMLRCETADGEVRLTFRRAVWHECATPYARVMDQRAASFDRQTYDAQLERTLSMYTEQPQIDYPDVNAAWTAFDRIFRAVSDVMTYEHTFRMVYRRLLQEMYDDHVMYLEIRTGFTLIYYDDNRNVTESDVVRELQIIIADFKQTHPKFHGMKFIYSKSRNTEQVDELLRKYRILKAQFPDLIVGFDLVGQEDVGKPLEMFIDKLLANRDIDYMFHAGETAVVHNLSTLLHKQKGPNQFSPQTYSQLNMSVFEPNFRNLLEVLLCLFNSKTSVPGSSDALKHLRGLPDFENGVVMWAHEVNSRRGPI